MLILEMQLFQFNNDSSILPRLLGFMSWVVKLVFQHFYLMHRQIISQNSLDYPGLLIWGYFHYDYIEINLRIWLQQNELLEIGL